MENNRENNRGGGYTPASFEKRALAWMGLAYALMMLFIITYAIFTGGKDLPGTFPLLLVPAAVTAAVAAIHRQWARKSRQGLPFTIALTALCIAATLLGLLWGGPAAVFAIIHAYD